MEDVGNNDSVRFSDYCTLRGTAAEGCADRWLAAVRKDSQKKLREMSPDVRLRVQPQIERWVAGRYQNLLLHEKREVRQGRILAIDNSIAKGAADTSNAVVTDATTEAENLATDRNNAVQLLAGDALAKRTAEIDKQRQDGHLRRMAQIAAENGEREKLIDDAVEQGLYSKEEGEARKMKTRHDVYGATIRALIDSNNEDTAEAMLDALESSVGGKKGQTIAGMCALSADEISGYRSAVQRVRDRKATDAKREAAEREDAAKNVAREKEIGLHLRPIPQDEAGQSAYFERMAVDYAELANDQTLPADTRLGYAKTARALGFQSVDSKASAARQQKAEQRSAKAERREQERELRAAVKQVQDDTFAVHESDFMAGGYFDEQGNWIDHTSATMKETADRCLADGKLSRVQWHKLMTMQQKQYGDEMGDFRNLVMSETKGIIPSCVTWHRNRFELQPSNRINASTKTSLEGGENEDKVTYRQLVEAMNLTCQWWKMRGKGASINDAKKHFDELTNGIVRGKMQRDVDAALEEEKQLINDWRMTNGR